VSIQFSLAEVNQVRVLVKAHVTSIWGWGSVVGAGDG